MPLYLFSNQQTLSNNSSSLFDVGVGFTVVVVVDAIHSQLVLRKQMEPWLQLQGFLDALNGVVSSCDSFY